MSNKTEKVLYLIFDITCAVLVLFVLFMVINSYVFKYKGEVNIFGITYFYADTADMEPEIEQGSFVKAKPESTYTVGDCVAYRARGFNGEKIVIGEVEEIIDGGYIVRGVNSASTDKEVKAAEIIGKAQTVSKNIEGAVYPLSETTTCLLYVILPAAITLSYGLMRLLVAIKERKDSRKNS